MKISQSSLTTGGPRLSSTESHSVARQMAWVAIAIAAFWLLVMAPGSAFAQVVPPSHGFAAKENDYFINFLLKGMLGDVINTGGTNAQSTISAAGNLGAVFKTFNLGVTFFGSLIVLFLVVIGILNTGSDGEFLGKQWSSMWVPIRFAGGAALLLPVTNSGYSFVQAMCLWIAVQGVGFADNVWSSMLTSVTRRTGSDIVSPVSFSSIAANAMASKLCAQYNNQIVNQSSPESSMKYDELAFAAGDREVSNTYAGWGTWKAKGVGSYGQAATLTPSDASCGYMQYSYRRDEQDPMNEIRARIASAHLLQMGAMNAAFDAPAAAYVRAMSGPPEGLAATKASVQAAIARASRAYETALTAAAADALTHSTLANASTMSEAFDKLGFAVAGAFYMELAKVQNAVRSGMQTAPTYVPPDASATSSANYQVVMSAVAETIGNAAVESARAGSMPTTVITGSQQATTVRTIDLNENMFRNYEERSFVASIFQSISFTIVESIVGVGSNNNNSYLAGWMNRDGGTNNNNTITGVQGFGPTFVNDNHSVIMQLKAKGDAILDIAGVVWGGFIAAKGAVAFGSSNVVVQVADLATGGGGKASALAAILEGLGAFVFTTVMGLITIGIILSVIIPTMPFMLWVMGIAGLLVLIIEALVASMLWAVMIMHPSGEGITSSHSRQGLMILLNLFMRPSLMLMGMVCGIFMVDPMVDFVNDMFFFVFKSTQASSYTMLFITFGFISVYCTLILAIVKKTFSLIHVVPDSVLSWIGGQTHNLGMTEAAEKAEGLAGTAGNRVSQGAEAFGGSMSRERVMERRRAFAASRRGPNRSEG